MDYIEQARIYGSQAKAAKALGIAKRTFERNIKRQRAQPKEVDRVSIPKIRIKSYKNPPKIVKIALVGDSHDKPGLCKDRFKHIAHWAKDYDLRIHLGDLADLNSLCSHIKNETFNGRLKGTVLEDMESLNEAVQLLNEAGTWTLLLGNHEHRVWNYQDSNPEIHGMLEDTFMGVFRSVGWETHPYGVTINVQGIDLVHAVKNPNNAKQRPYEGKTAAQQVANNAGRDTIFGHIHKFLMHNVARNAGANVKVFSMPCSMPHGYLPDYVSPGVPDWDYGVVGLTVCEGKIIGIDYVSMLELEIEYEKK